MALSDEILEVPGKLARLREALSAGLSETDAGAAFLLDEEGTPFATVGNIEFSLPEPVAGLDELLSTLVGAGGASSPYLVERAGTRALVVLLFDSPARASEHRDEAKALAAEIRSLLG